MRARFVAVVAVAAALSLAAEPGPASASCPDAVRWNGVLYAGWPARIAVAAGAPAGVGTIAACDDMIGVLRAPPAAPAPDVPIALSAVQGVDPRIALAHPYTRTVYLAEGFFPDHPGYPLRGVIDRPRARPNSALGCPKRPLRTRTAVVERVGFDGIVQLAGWRRELVTDGVTRFALRHVAGQPHLRAGERVRVEMLECGVPGRQRLIARRLTLVR